MTLNVGMIGCGAISESHLQALAGRPDVDVKACADVNRASAQRRADQFGIPQVYSAADAVLDRDDIDLVVITVPPKWHHALFLAAVERGKHVVIEKPLAMSLHQAHLMAEAAEQCNRITGVALVHRYLPGYHALRQLVESGAIGQVRMVRLEFGRNMYGDSRFLQPDSDPRGWLVNREIAGGGLLLSSTIHFLSAIAFVLGDPRAVQMTARVGELHPNAYAGIEDDVDLWITYEDGTECVLRESWLCNVPYRAEFVGECGQLVVTADESWSSLSVSGICRGKVPAEYQPFQNGNEFRATSEELTAPCPSLFGGLVEDVLQSIYTGEISRRLPSVSHARNMQSLAAAAYRSQKLASRQPIDWRLDTN